MKIRRHPGDLPYTCFFIFGVTILGMASIRASYTDAEWANGAGAIFLLLLPLIALASIAGLIGVGLSFWLWREWPLPVLSGASVALVAAGFVSVIPPWLQTAIPFVYGAGVCVICGAWVFRRRGRELRALAARRPA